jgi:hypothetical protein
VAPAGTVNDAVATPSAPVTPEPVDVPSVKATVLPANAAKLFGFETLYSKVAETVMIAPQVPELGLMVAV